MHGGGGSFLAPLPPPPACAACLTCTAPPRQEKRFDPGAADIVATWAGRKDLRAMLATLPQVMGYGGG
jgi:hypothetical protein